MLMSPGRPLVSFVVSSAGVASSMPSPETGQMLESLLCSLLGPPRRVEVQLVLPQFGLLSFRMPKFEPPTTSR